MKKLLALLLTVLIACCFVGCGETKPEDNIAFDSVEEMQECLNGKWFSIDDGVSMFPYYKEIVFDNYEIKECKVYGWFFNRDSGERTTQQNQNKEFRKLEYSYEPQFKHKTGQVFFSSKNINNIDIKESIYMTDGREIKEICLVIGSSVFFKATDNIDYSIDNFVTYENFCELALSKNENNPFSNMYYDYDTNENGLVAGIDDEDFFLYGGCDSDEISFEIWQDTSYPKHYFARTDKFNSLYNEIKNLYYNQRTKIIGIIGTEMPDFDKKDWKYHSFYELKYYLYMNSDGKLISNIK